jgi:hypothetical protein
MFSKCYRPLIAIAKTKEQGIVGLRFNIGYVNHFIHGLISSGGKCTSLLPCLQQFFLP